MALPIYKNISAIQRGYPIHNWEFVITEKPTGIFVPDDTVFSYRCTSSGIPKAVTSVNKESIKSFNLWTNATVSYTGEIELKFYDGVDASLLKFFKGYRDAMRDHETNAAVRINSLKFTSQLFLYDTDRSTLLSEWTLRGCIFTSLPTISSLSGDHGATNPTLTTKIGYETFDEKYLR